MKFIRHRVNAISQLPALKPGWGAEIDLRSRGNKIVLCHDPFTDGDGLELFLQQWKAGANRGTLILNPKEDGLEGMVLERLRTHAIEDFFFLDLPLPTVVKLAVRQGMPKVAIRVSEHELLDSALTLAGRVDWAWVDCFSGNPPAIDLIAKLSQSFRVCLVSPELQAFPPAAIERFLPLRSHAAAVCTKHPELWGYSDVIR
jgi:hypothetical protein